MTARESAPPATFEDLVRQAEALEPKSRMAYLQQACGTDEALLSRAIAQLRESTPQWWEHSLESRAVDAERSIPPRTSETIGPYRIVRPLGQGGMGEVLLAERDDREFRQQVAIKLVRSGAISQNVQGRLKSERQILATLDHPNIARLLDGGTTADQTPYIVMEYIEGESIDVYCDRQRLSIEARLQLFRTVCAAVHCAHQNLIVHRDLKPSNILVTQDGTPKLLDFGIAKILDDRPLLHTMAVTQMDVRVMTPEHASPEQIRGEPITTASDVYALGVLLYELLTGRKPYTIKSSRLSEIEQAICEQEPVPLNSRLQAGDVDTAILTTCDARSTTPARLRRLLSGDLANIVMTAMRKEPERRYPSAEQLSADIGRFLADMPVLASKDSWRYRAGKFLRRHSLAAGFGALALVGVLAFALVTTLQARRIAREQARAEQVSSFLVDMFEQADPTHSRGREITVRELLDVGSRRIASKLADQPDTRAHLQATIGKVYADLGLYSEAEALLRESLDARRRQYGEDDPQTAVSMQYLGDMLLNKKDIASAEPLLENAIEIKRKSTAVSAVQLASSLRSLSELRQEQQRLDEAEQLLRESLQVLDSSQPAGSAEKLSVDAEKAATLNRLAIVLRRKGDLSGAEVTYRSALAIATQSLGSDHPIVAFVTHNLAWVIQLQDRPQEALPLMVESVQLYRRIFGPEHPETLSALANYGSLQRRLKDLDGAERTYREVLALHAKVFGGDHSLVGYDHINLGGLLQDKAQYREAEAELHKALDNFKSSLPPNHPYEGAARRSLGLALMAQARHAEAEQQLRRAVAIYRETQSPSDPQFVLANGALGAALAAQKRFAEAEPLLLDNYRLLLVARGAENPVTIRLRGWIEELYADWGKPDEAQHFFASLTTVPAVTRSD